VSLDLNHSEAVRSVNYMFYRLYNLTQKYCFLAERCALTAPFFLRLRLQDQSFTAMTTDRQPVDKQGITPGGVYDELLELVDLTSLEAADHTERIRALCHKALDIRSSSARGRGIAAVCVYPVFAAQVSKILKGSGIRTAVVAGGFPSGQMALRLRAEECRMAVEEGAAEIDMVISRGRFLAGDTSFLSEEVGTFADICRGRARLKVILETGELQSEALIRQASRLALEAGAGFIKTSTGKIAIGATTEAFSFMLQEIVAFYDKTGDMRGIKASGGIAAPENALLYYRLTEEIAGAGWLSPEYLRLGASRLVDTLADATR
jgi:deoxyribose-phosphate aldolase